MAITDARLSIIAFPQRWNGADIAYRALVLPKGNPRLPHFLDAPAFADAKLHLRARLIPGLDRIPNPADALPPGTVVVETPSGVPGVYDALADTFSINATLTGNPRPAVTFKKYLTRSYRSAFAFDGPSRPYVYTGDAYECALKDPATSNRPPRPAPTGELSWGQTLAFALRQPRLASALGLLFRGTVSVPNPEQFEAGGWLYVELAPSSDYAAAAAGQPGSVGLLAARLPALTFPRALFASVSFPVDAGMTGSFDEQFIDADSYDDGFAKIVHGSQPEHGAVLETEKQAAPVVKDVGVRLGWDDEQIAVWLNRQVQVNTVTPTGVAGYRVDVKEADTAEWRSLTRARGQVRLGPLDLGAFDDELVVEAVPQQLAGQKTGDYWLPSYFTTWKGSSIVLRNETALRLAKRDDVLADRPFVVPNANDIPDLRYGHAYDFRVRLVDLSQGGPSVDDGPINPAPAPETTVRFRRFSPPRAVRLEDHPDQPEDEPQTLLRVGRPLLGYPDAVFADVPNAEALLLADLADAGEAERETGLPDPDVVHVEITVEVRSPDPPAGRGGSAQYVPIYTTTREFDDDPGTPVDLVINYVDHVNLGALEAADPLRPEPGVGPVEVPTARDVRLRLTAVCKEDLDLDYFGAEAARRSPTAACVQLRAPSKDERQLFAPDVPGQQVRALFLQPDTPPIPNHAATRLAEQLRLNVSNLTFTGLRGRRTIFGCSGTLRHTLAPDRSAITFAAASDLIRQWVIAIRVTLDRDWTWDALAEVSFEIVRDGDVVGTIDMPRMLPQLAGWGDRNQTSLVFFHAIDPKPRPGDFPAEIHTTFSVRARFRHPPELEDEPLEWTLRLPVAVAPTQTPKLVSAGLALSPYDASPEYSSTTGRQRMLWLEFEAPPADPQDQYFARVVAYAPDPMLLHESTQIPMPAEPPLAIEPELIRVVTPAQSQDEAGANAMQPLQTSPAESAHMARTLLVPLPDGLDAGSPDLFGFFVYEVRVGHGAGRWSTAQARFGAALRIAGVQHPAPLLVCHVSRTADAIHVDAPYATPVFEGRNLRARVPNTELWVLLYVQVMQLDGETRRNVLLLRARAEPLSIPQSDQLYGDDLLLFGSVRFPQHMVLERLAELGLPKSLPLSVLAAELLPQPAVTRYPDPLGGDLGQVRILRTSPLHPVPEIC